MWPAAGVVAASVLLLAAPGGVNGTPPLKNGPSEADLCLYEDGQDSDGICDACFTECSGCLAAANSVCYFLVTEQATMEETETYCRSLGPHVHVACPPTAEVYREIFQVAKNNLQVCDSWDNNVDNDCAWWLGLLNTTSTSTSKTLDGSAAGFRLLAGGASNACENKGVGATLFQGLPESMQACNGRFSVDACVGSGVADSDGDGICDVADSWKGHGAPVVVPNICPAILPSTSSTTLAMTISTCTSATTSASTTQHDEVGNPSHVCISQGEDCRGGPHTTTSTVCTTIASTSPCILALTTTTDTKCFVGTTDAPLNNQRCVHATDAQAVAATHTCGLSPSASGGDGTCSSTVSTSQDGGGGSASSPIIVIRFEDSGASDIGAISASAGGSDSGSVGTGHDHRGGGDSSPSNCHTPDTMCIGHTRPPTATAFEFSLNSTSSDPDGTPFGSGGHGQHAGKEDQLLAAIFIGVVVKVLTVLGAAVSIVGWMMRTKSSGHAAVHLLPPGGERVPVEEVVVVVVVAVVACAKRCSRQVTVATFAAATAAARKSTQASEHCGPRG